MSGHFFVFDGMDGAGKSTAIAMLAEYLRAQGHEVLCTREPGGTPLAESIRHCMLADWEEGMPIQTELLLVFAARAAHLHNCVQPALAAGKIVLCDRFIDSSFVYQGGLGGIPESWIRQLVTQTVPCQPELCFILDLPAHIAQQRLAGRGHENRFDREDLQRLTRVRELFQARVAATPRTHRLIDASGGPERIQQQLITHLQDRLA